MVVVVAVLVVAAFLELASLARPSGSEVWLQVCHCQLGSGKTAVVVVLNSSTIVVVAGYRSATAKTAAVVAVVVVVALVEVVVAVVVLVVILVLLSNCSTPSMEANAV